MKNTSQSNPDSGTIAWSTNAIEKIHRCEDCPIRLLAIKRPQSIYARLHAWHRTWWPGWKSYQARTCPFAARTGTHA